MGIALQRGVRVLRGARGARHDLRRPAARRPERRGRRRRRGLRREGLRRLPRVHGGARLRRTARARRRSSRRRGSAARVLRERAQHDGVEVPARRGGSRSAARASIAIITASAVDAVRLERRPPATELVEDHAERQMSLRASTSFVERICSGDMYSGEPNVDRRLRERRRSAPVGDLRDAEVEHLHERRCRRAVASRNRFAGLRSRCTMPSACASASAVARLQHVVDARPRRAAARASRSSLREIAPVEQLHHHVRRAVVERADVETRATCSLLSCAAARASRRKRCTRLGSPPPRRGGT